MVMTGRNEPCPCGSNKKYKRCCLSKDAAGSNTLDFQYEKDLRVRRRVVEKLQAMILDGESKDSIELFQETYWASPFLEPSSIKRLIDHPEAKEHFFDHFPMALLHAYLMESALLPADYALEHRAWGFTADERNFLERFAGARLTFLQLREFFPEEGCMVGEDIFDGEIYRVYDKMASGSVAIHTIVPVRLVEFPEKRAYVFEPIASSAFPPDTKESIRDLVKRAHGTYGANAEDIHTFLASEPLVFFWLDMWLWHRMLFPVRPELRTTDGERIVFITAKWQAQDAKECVERLARMRNMAYDMEAGVHIFRWISRTDAVRGILKVSEATGLIELETNSRARFSKWRKKLEALPDLELLEKTETPLEDSLQGAVGSDGFRSEPDRLRGPSSHSGAPALLEDGLQLSDSDLRAIAAEFQDQMWNRMVDDRVPALGNRTPREACRTQEGRLKVREWLDGMEHFYASSPKDSPMHYFDVDRLRRMLGLLGD